MTLDAVISALAIPDTARVDQRITKKLLTEQGAPTAADKRAIQDGVNELLWIAALKPTNIGVPIWKGEAGEYLEIAIITASLREGAKVARLTELIHRAVPYPVLLLVADGETVQLSLAHKRASQAEKAAVVLDGPLVCATTGSEGDALGATFLASLSIARQPQQHLWALYQGWIDCCAGLAASNLTGAFNLPKSPEEAALRRAALDTHTRVTREIAMLRKKAARETQINRRVELNLAIQRLEAELVAAKATLARGQG
ncbi:MAG: DUF4391 domain-containing protein [Alphaproteobacteria bacterium]|nr:DUF4391 domain-containing protein [Alphaproteobacteria bacterium]